MKLSRVRIKNYRSIVDAEFELSSYNVLVGANNAGKSTIINAIRVFYDDLKWSSEDFPKMGADGDESWIDLVFSLSNAEFESLPDKYKVFNNELRVRKYLKSVDRVKSNQSNIYAFLGEDELEDNLFFGAKNISQAKLGSVIYVPALTTPADAMKTTGPSPLRNMLTLVLKNVVSKSQSYKKIQDAFDEFNEEAQGDEGFLSVLSRPINESLSSWGIRMGVQFKGVSTDDLVKSLVNSTFQDENVEGAEFSIEKFGHGFQRSVIYELIRLSASFQGDAKEGGKKEFFPQFSLILFEEPEAFLHPEQQVNMALGLRHLGSIDGQQVVATTHSPVFISKSSYNLNEIIRVAKEGGISRVYQVPASKLDDLFGAGMALGEVLKKAIDKPDVEENKKGNIQKLINGLPAQDVAEAEERFRHQMWLEGERCSVFFSSKAILCEGPSERVLFNYLLENQWSDLRLKRVCVIDTLGKYNMHRCISLMRGFGIPYSVVIDGDNNKLEHQVLNEFIKDCCSEGGAISYPHIFEEDIEKFLGIEKPNRSERKPLNIIMSISSGKIDCNKVSDLRVIFENLCGISREDKINIAAE